MGLRMGEQRRGLVGTSVARRVVFAVVTNSVTEVVAEALRDEGFDVLLDQTLEHVVATPEFTDETASLVVVFDESNQDWMRQVADLTRGRTRVGALLLSNLDQPDEFLAALNAGVGGFCRPDAGAEAIVRTVRAVHESGVAIPRDLVVPLVEQVRRGRGHSVHTAAGVIDVTDREWQVMQLLLQRRTTREMAEELLVSVATVRSHVSALMKKLGAVDRDDAIALIERGAPRAARDGAVRATLSRGRGREISAPEVRER